MNINLNKREPVVNETIVNAQGHQTNLTEEMKMQSEMRKNPDLRVSLQKFLTDIQDALMVPDIVDQAGTPCIEADRDVCEHYNRNTEAFDSVGYFIFQGVKVFERGKLESSSRKDRMTMEQKLHGRS